MCGGTIASVLWTGSGTGLSPRVRGNRQRQHGERRPHRVYPRVCGGTGDIWQYFQPVEGLSPRVRGNQHAAVISHAHAGSIPACAGEPNPYRIARAPRRVYPPRVRGNRKGYSIQRTTIGSYPRVCGGTTCSPAVRPLVMGLSPRVRGNHECLDGSANPEGSIPACAGEPSKPTGPRALTRVYPRVCGGTITVASSQTMNKGLSPRVRGNRILRLSCFHKPGSIPACAGEPGLERAGVEVIKVYPRVCGGTNLPSRD